MSFLLRDPQKRNQLISLLSAQKENPSQNNLRTIEEMLIPAPQHKGVVDKIIEEELEKIRIENENKANKL